MKPVINRQFSKLTGSPGSKIAVGTALFHLTLGVCGAPLYPTIFNTGVDASGNVLAAGVPDPHYTLIAPSVAAAYTATSATPVVGVWIPDNTTSTWITPERSQNAIAPGGSYTYQMNFLLNSAEAGALNATGLNGLWALDDAVAGTFDILLNGTSLSPVNSSAYTAFDPFGVGPSSLFLPGNNTLEFVVVNAGSGPTGLRVEIVPESGGALLTAAGLGLAVAGLALRKRLTVARTITAT